MKKGKTHGNSGKTSISKEDLQKLKDNQISVVFGYDKLEDIIDELQNKIDRINDLREEIEDITHET